MESLSSGQKSSFTRLRNQIKDEFETAQWFRLGGSLAHPLMQLHATHINL